MDSADSKRGPTLEHCSACTTLTWETLRWATKTSATLTWATLTSANFVSHNLRRLPLQTDLHANLSDAHRISRDRVAWVADPAGCTVGPGSDRKRVGDCSTVSGFHHRIGKNGHRRSRLRSGCTFCDRRTHRLASVDGLIEWHPAVISGYHAIKPGTRLVPCPV